jgi:hypothetical protein
MALDYARPPKPQPLITPRKLVTFGLALLLVSLPVLCLMLLEIVTDAHVRARYSVKPINDWEMPISFAGRTVKLYSQQNSASSKIEIDHVVGTPSIFRPIP